MLVCRWATKTEALKEEVTECGAELEEVMIRRIDWRESQTWCDVKVESHPRSSTRPQHCTHVIARPRGSEVPGRDSGLRSLLSATAALIHTTV